MSRLGVIVVGFASLTIIGCGPGGPSTYPVKGKVTVGGQPLEGVNVTFNPVENTNPIATGTTQSDGSFQLSSGAEGKPGAAAGKYKVTLQQTMVGGMEAMQAAYQNKGATKPGPPKVESKIPAEFSSLTTTKKEVEVTAGENVINIDL